MSIFQDLFFSRGSVDIREDVDNAIAAFESGNISAMQNHLYQLGNKINKPGSGRLITRFSQKDRLCECFTLCLQHDWMHDSDIREAWAENGFYCIVDYLVNHVKNAQDMIAGGLDLFLLIQNGKKDLKPKVSEILRKAEMRGESVFADADYENGADYLIDQIAYWAACLIKPFASEILDGINYQKFNMLMNRGYEFAPAASKGIPEKAMFISRIIESVLNDM